LSPHKLGIRLSPALPHCPTAALPQSRGAGMACVLDLGVRRGDALVLGGHSCEFDA
jgi:hypothetical protein